MACKTPEESDRPLPDFVFDLHCALLKLGGNNHPPQDPEHVQVEERVKHGPSDDDDASNSSKGDLPGVIFDIHAQLMGLVEEKRTRGNWETKYSNMQIYGETGQVVAEKSFFLGVNSTKQTQPAPVCDEADAQNENMGAQDENLRDGPGTPPPNRQSLPESFQNMHRNLLQLGLPEQKFSVVEGDDEADIDSVISSVLNDARKKSQGASGGGGSILHDHAQLLDMLFDNETKEPQLEGSTRKLQKLDSETAGGEDVEVPQTRFFDPINPERFAKNSETITGLSTEQTPETNFLDGPGTPPTATQHNPAAISNLHAMLMDLTTQSTPTERAGTDQSVNTTVGEISLFMDGPGTPPLQESEFASETISDYHTALLGLMHKYPEQQISLRASPGDATSVAVEGILGRIDTVDDAQISGVSEFKRSATAGEKYHTHVEQGAPPQVSHYRNEGFGGGGGANIDVFSEICDRVLAGENGTLPSKNPEYRLGLFGMERVRSTDEKETGTENPGFVLDVPTGPVSERKTTELPLMVYELHQKMMSLGAPKRKNPTSSAREVVDNGLFGFQSRFPV